MFLNKTFLHTFLNYLIIILFLNLKYIAWESPVFLFTVFKMMFFCPLMCFEEKEILKKFKDYKMGLNSSFKLKKPNTSSLGLSIQCIWLSSSSSRLTSRFSTVMFRGSPCICSRGHPVYVSWDTLYMFRGTPCICSRGHPVYVPGDTLYMFQIYEKSFNGKITVLW